MRRLSGASTILMVFLLALGTWHVGAWQAAGAPAQGLTLIVSPSAIPPHQVSALTVRAIDASGLSVAGTSIAVSGGTIPGGTPTVGSGPVQLRVTPAGNASVTISAAHSGYQTASTQVRVVVPPLPAAVSAIAPSMGVAPANQTSFQPASLHANLDFKWRARTSASERGALTFADASVLDLDHSTTVLIKNPTRTYLDTGQVFVQVESHGQAHDLETGNAVAASLGTAYLAMAQTIAGELVTTVTVISGRVVLTGNGATVSLGPGQRCTVRGKHRPTTPQNVSTAPLVRWTEGLPKAQGSDLEHVAFVLQGGGRQLTTFSIDRQAIVRMQALPEKGMDLAASADDAHVYVATDGGVWDDQLPKGTLRRLAGNIHPSAIALLPGKQLAVANFGGKSVLVISAANGSTIKEVALGYAPTGIAASPSGDTAIVVGVGEVSLVDLQNGVLITTRDQTGPGGRPTFSQDGEMGYAPFAGQLLELSVTAEGVVGSTPIGVFSGEGPGSGAGPLDYPAALSSRGGLVYGVDYGNRQIEVIDPGAQAVISHFSLSAHPTNVGWAADGKLITLTAQQSGILGVDPSGGRVLTIKYLGGLGDPLAVSHLPVQRTEPSGYTPSVGSTVPHFGPIQKVPGGASTPTSTSTSSPTITATFTPTVFVTPTVTLTPSPTPITAFILTPNPVPVIGTFNIAKELGSCTQTPSYPYYSQGFPVQFDAPLNFLETFDLRPLLKINFFPPNNPYGSNTGIQVDPLSVSGGPIGLDGAFTSFGLAGDWIGTIAVSGAGSGTWTYTSGSCTLTYNVVFATIPK